MFQLFNYSSSPKLFTIICKLDNFFFKFCFYFLKNFTTEKSSRGECYVIVTEEEDRRFGLGLHRKFLCVSEAWRHGV